MTTCRQCGYPCCACNCPGCHCQILTGPNGVQCCTMCITGLQRQEQAVKQVNTPPVQGAQSPEIMEQIVKQRLQLVQLNRFRT